MGIDSGPSNQRGHWSCPSCKLTVQPASGAAGRRYGAEAMSSFCRASNAQHAVVIWNRQAWAPLTICIRSTGSITFGCCPRRGIGGEHGDPRIFVPVSGDCQPATRPGSGYLLPALGVLSGLGKADGLLPLRRVAETDSWGDAVRQANSG